MNLFRSHISFLYAFHVKKGDRTELSAAMRGFADEREQLGLRIGHMTVSAPLFQHHSLISHYIYSKYFTRYTVIHIELLI